MFQWIRRSQNINTTVDRNAAADTLGSVNLYNDMRLCGLLYEKHLADALSNTEDLVPENILITI